MPPKVVKGKAAPSSTTMFAYNQKAGTQAPQPVLLPPYRRQDVCAVVIRTLETPSTPSRLLALYLRGTRVHAKWVVKSVPREVIAVSLPAPGAAPASATPSDVPSPTPDPKRRGSTPSGGAKAPAAGGAPVVAAPVAAPIAKPYCPSYPYPDDDTTESVALVLPEYGDLANVVATRIVGVDGGHAALIATETYGILVVGYLPGEPLPEGPASVTAVPIRLASQMAATSVARTAAVYSIACGSRHALAVVDDVDAAYRGIRVSSVVGWGYTDTSALGTPGPSLTSVGPTEGLGKVPRRVHDLKQVGKPSLHEGAWPESFLPFVKLADGDFASPPPSAVFAGRNMSFLVTAAGLFACGTLSTHVTFAKPTLVLDLPRPAVIGVVVLNRCAYALLRGNRLYCLGEHDGVGNKKKDSDDGRETTKSQGMFEDVTDAILGQLPADASLTKIAAGAEHVIVTDTANGRAYGWGLNSFTQLGESPAKVGLCVPTAVTLTKVPTNFSSIHCWGMSTLVLDGHKEQIAKFGN